MELIMYTPGPQNPGAYPHTGPHYAEWGDLTAYGLVYDPFVDAYRYDPAQKQNYYESMGWVPPTPSVPKPPSMAQQALLMAAPTAANVAGQYLAQQLGLGAAQGGAQGTGLLGSLFGGGGGAAAQAASQGAMQGPLTQGAQMMNNLGIGRETAQSIANATPYLGLLGAGLGGYGLYNAIKKGDKKSGALSGASLMGGLGAAAPLAGLALGPLGIGGMALGGLLGGLGLGSINDRKTTKEYQQERRAALSPALQLTTARDPNDTGVWKDGKYAGQKWSWDKALDLAKDDPWHFIGNFGNFQTFGEDWVHTPEEKQRQVVSQLIDQGLYRSDKGDILISDPNRAKEIYQNVMGG